MLRVKIPQGIATAAQLRALADVAARWSRGYGHVTTRQNVQLHFVQPADLEPALRLLAGAGITTSGAGGNTVRNVAACPYAGVAPDEPFDVTPYAEAVTRHFLRHPLASSLPRKLKLAFEGCQEDHAATAIQDLGFRARIREERGLVRRGFAVTVAGGTSSLCTSGHPLFEFFPAEDVLVLAEALVRLFHARGDRKNKQRNRLKFLVRELGFESSRRCSRRSWPTSGWRARRRCRSTSTRAERRRLRGPASLRPRPPSSRRASRPRLCAGPVSRRRSSRSSTHAPTSWRPFGRQMFDHSGRRGSRW